MITSTDLQVIFIIYYDNNPEGYKNAFKNAGYVVPAGNAQAKSFIVKKMYDLYFSNPTALAGIMAQAPWNPTARNYTTSEETASKVHAEMQQNLAGYSNTTGKFDFGNFFNGFQNFLLGNQQTVTQQTVVTPVSSAANTIGLAIVFSVLGIGVIALVIFAIKSMKS